MVQRVLNTGFNTLHRDATPFRVAYSSPNSSEGVLNLSVNQKSAPILFDCGCGTFCAGKYDSMFDHGVRKGSCDFKTHFKSAVQNQQADLHTKECQLSEFTGVENNDLVSRIFERASAQPALRDGKKCTRGHSLRAPFSAECDLLLGFRCPL